ncbi:MAG TPA: GH39 family glycosyl hydrolase [Candidatus Wujingus californicus]|uniref:GH39 family glycosyl hydrolase n=1 Tax=Candidatus Wujingus californicus TaxID=3367618 RepID=UPI0040259DEC
MKYSSISRIFVLIIILTTICRCILLAEDISVKVNASNDMGTVSDVLSSSIWIQNLENPGSSYIIGKFFKDNKPAVVQLSLNVLKDSRSFEDFKTSLEKYFKIPSVVNFIKKAREYDTLVIVGFEPSPMPGWLSSRPGDMSTVTLRDYDVQSCSPPKDYKVWGEIVKCTLKQFHLLGLKNLGFYVGHEPNRDWLGSEESLFKYYETAALAAKSIDEQIKVGGIGSISYTGKKFGCDYKDYTDHIKKMCLEEGGWADPDKEPITKNFIEYMARGKIPLDFINWHSFGANPSSFVKQANLIRSWLNENKLNNVKLFLSDWTYWCQRYPADYLDTTECASYIITALNYMRLAGIDWHGHDFDVRDYGGRENSIKKTRNNSTFIGDWSLFTWGGAAGGGVVKPAYNAFCAVSRAVNYGSSRCIQASYDKDKAAVISTVSDDKQKVSVLISCFAPQRKKQVRTYLQNMLEEETEFVRDELQMIKKCVLEAGGSRSKKNISDRIKICRDKIAARINSPEKMEMVEYILNVYSCLVDNERRIEWVMSASKGLKYPATIKTANRIEQFLKTLKETKKTTIEIEGIPFNGDASLTTYAIDSNHSNACSFNKNTEPNKTNTPCGIAGKVDQAIWNVKKESMKHAIKVVCDHFLTLGYTDKETDILRKHSEGTEGNKNIKDILAQIALEISLNSSCPIEKIRSDLKESFRIYTESYNKLYYNAVNEINNWKEISLEGSKTKQSIPIKDNRFTLNLNMEPNSVWLIILAK